MHLYLCLGSGNCMKPWLAMHQLDIPFEMTLIDVLKGEQKSDAYRAINPLGVVPWLVTDEGQGIGESNAMLWYLAEGTRLMPGTRAERAEALQWMLYEQCKLEPFISPARFCTTILPELADARRDEIAEWQQKARPGLAHLDAHLSGRDFMLRSGYTIADIALFGYVHVADEADIDLKDYPNIGRWIARVQGTRRFRPLSELGRRAAYAA